MTNKKVEMQLVGEDGNAFAILGRFLKAARKSGWTKEEINAVFDEAKSGDYSHLLATISKYVEEPFGEEDEDEDLEDEYNKNIRQQEIERLKEDQW